MNDLGSNMEPKWVQNRSQRTSEIIEKPEVFIVFWALGGSRRRPERRLQNQKIVKIQLGFMVFS